MRWRWEVAAGVTTARCEIKDGLWPTIKHSNSLESIVRPRELERGRAGPARNDVNLHRIDDRLAIPCVEVACISIVLEDYGVRFGRRRRAMNCRLPERDLFLKMDARSHGEQI